jgi:hypothetical protein
MLYIIWKDYDGYYTERFGHRDELSVRLLQIKREEERDEYGVEIIMVASAAEIDYEYSVELIYVFDKVNRIERLSLDGDIKITNEIQVEEKVMKCPKCGKAGKKGKPIKTFVESVYSTLDHYTCSSCEKGFYI